MVVRRKKTRIRRSRTPSPANDPIPSIWTRLKDGITPPPDYQLYYKCFLTFLILYVYLIVGGIFLWMIETSPAKTVFNRNQPSPDTKDRFRYPPIRYSRDWTLFEAGFMCYSVVSGSGAYSDLTVDTKLGKLYLVFYAALGCPLLFLVISYMVAVLTVWGHVLSTFTVNVVDVLQYYLFRRTHIPLRSQRSVDEMYRSSLSWPVAFFFLNFYTLIGSWMFLYNENTDMFEVVYSSYNAFATVEVAKVFDVPSRSFVYLLYLLFGIAVFQIYIECSKNRLDKILFKDDDN